MATHSSIPAWRIPWTEEPGGLQSMGSQRVRHDWATNTFTFFSEQPRDGSWKGGTVRTQGYCRDKENSRPTGKMTTTTQLGKCSRLNVCVPPKFIYGVLIPQDDGIRRWGLGHKGFTSWDEYLRLQKGPQPLAPESVRSLWPKRGLSLDHAGTLSLDFQFPDLGEINFCGL